MDKYIYVWHMYSEMVISLYVSTKTNVRPAGLEHGVESDVGMNNKDLFT